MNWWHGFKNRMASFGTEVLQQQLPEKRISFPLQITAVLWSLMCIMFILFVMLLHQDLDSLDTVTIAYDHLPISTSSQNITFTMSNFEPPIYVYYELENYYQNHRRYIKSRNDAQLTGETVTSAKSLEDCEPLLYADESKSGASRFYNPCGLISASWFPDSFSLSATDAHEIIHLDQTNIAWEGDREVRFKKPKQYVGTFPQDDQGRWSADSFQDESFMVWMRPSALPRFRKLYGVIRNKLDASNYTLMVNNRLDVAPFHGKKSIVLRTRTTFSGNGGSSLLGFAAACLAISTFGLFLLLVPVVQKSCRREQDGWSANGYYQTHT
eukprot:TRINITY_DN13299_c0_g1_i1.p1 TRINITY_DN13299_c0_g1~~TRINITY_DN13299_c0_g1_i1.p1  ORF type:complete len:325 (+),score=65.75 TRINITY_DN13299_c0_g1_i1:71-1045(+)